MRTAFGHLGYCTNIHGGESWQEHFSNIRSVIPRVKERLSPDQPFGIGLRLANEASIELLQKGPMHSFQQWLQQENCYVFTLNGFPYGGFHQMVVKDQVHAPDWTTRERVDYTKRLADILAVLLPEGMDGGISTSPISYKHWYAEAESRSGALRKGTENLLEVVQHLIRLKKETGKSIHLDLEPEPGGLIETGTEFLQWYEAVLLPASIESLKKQWQLPEAEAVAAIKEHLQLCFDVCHFAVGFEDVAAVIKQLSTKGLKVGKIQVSAALRAVLPDDAEERNKVIAAFHPFNEPVYLHQVIALKHNGEQTYYADLPEALADAASREAKEWRAHFHVPLFVKDYGLLQSTQPEIETVIAIQKARPFTSQLEVETYTWDVLPDALKLPLAESIIREMEWVKALLEAQPVVR